MAYFGPYSRFGDLMGSAEAVAVIDKYMPGATPYLKPEASMMNLSLQRIVSSYPPEVGKAFVQEIEQCSADKLHGGQIFAKALKQEGVDTVFTLGGDHTMAMYYGLMDEGIKLIDLRHESAAVLAVDGYCRASGKPGVVIVTAGPGEGNAFGGFLDCVQGDLPVLLVAGGCPVSGFQQGVMQEFDFLPTYRSVCRWAERVYSTDRIADYVHIAFRQMTSGAMGPAFLQIPYDVVNELAPARCAADPGRTRLNDPIPGNPEAVEAAVELLAQAKKPVLVVGRETRFFPSNVEFIRKLSDYLLMPIYNMWEAEGMYGDEAENPRYTLGAMATSGADLFITVNLNPDYMYCRMTAPGWNPWAKTISVNVDSKRIGYNHSFDVGIVGTPGDVCKQIYESFSAKYAQRTDDSFVQEIIAMAQMYATPEAELNDETVPINPKRACKEVRAFVDKHRDWGMVTEGGDAAANMLGIPFQFPGQYCFESRLGCIGTGLPMAIGAYFGHGHKTMLVTGDGSLGFYLTELSTAIHRKVPLVVVVLNDSCWGMIRGMEFGIHADVLKQHEDKDFYGVGLNLPPNLRFDQVCEAFGGYGELVTKPEDIIPALERADKSGKVAVVNIIIGEITHPGNMGMSTAGYCVDFKPVVKF